MATKIQLRRDTAANWETSNPVLSQGEPGLAIDTNTVKYGDGVTDWKSLPASTDYAMTASSGNQWQYRTTSGGTSFTYVIAGNIPTQFTVPIEQENASTDTLLIDVATHPTITSVEQALINYNNAGNGPRPFFSINDGSPYYVTGYSLAAGIATITLDDTYTLNEGDQVLINAWTKGTQGIYPRYRSTYGPGEATQYNVSNNGYHWGPIADAANTNTVTVDFSGENSTFIATLLANPYRNYIVFDEFTTTASAVIKTATQVGSSNNYTLTFDGQPKDLFAKSQVTLDCKLAYDQTDSYNLILNSIAYPQLVDFLYTSGAQYAPGEAYFTINDSATQYFVQGFWPRGGGTGVTPGLDSDGNWSIQVDEFTATVQDTIHLHYTKAGTFIRMDYYLPDESYYTDQTENNNVYRWFSWEDDLPFYKAAHGNGVQGGWLDFHIQCSWPKTKSSNAADNKTVSIFFNPRGESYGDALNSLDATTSFQGDIFNDTEFGYNVDFRPIYDLYEGGIFFKADYGDGYPGSISQEIKVDIIWNARLFYGDDPTYEYWP